MTLPLVALNEILSPVDRAETPVPGKLYRQIGVRLWGEGAYEREPIDGAATQYQRLFQTRANDVIVNKIWARNGSVAVVPENLEGCYGSSEFPMFAPVLEKLEPRWFHWMTKTKDFWSKCDEKSRGTSGKNRIRPERFLEIEIPLPPLSEQRRILPRIEELAAKIQQALSLRRDTVDESETLLDSVIGATFTKMESVERKPLATLTSKIGSGSTPLGGRAFYPSSGVPFIRSMNVRMRQFQWDGIVFIDKATHETMSGTQVRPNDVLLNITGASIGRVACAPTDLVEANVNQHVAIIRPLEGLNPRCLMYWISQSGVQEFINKEQKGATRQGFTKEQIGALEIPILPLAEQKNIVSFLDALQTRVNSLKDLQTQTVAELEQLQPSILDKAFKGEL